MKLLAFILLVFSIISVRAGIRPSFNLDYCAWNATDIVVATEGDVIDGKLTVIESWKVNLLPGDQLNLPEMAQFAPEESRAIKVGFGQQTTSVEHVTGTRMVIYLKKSEPTTPQSSIHWEGASFAGDLNVSVVWLEGMHAYGFLQLMNPGPSELRELDKSDAEIKYRTSDIVDEEALFRNALSNPDNGKRASALAKFTRSELFLARDRAFEGLSQCGPAALPVLRAILRDETQTEIHSDAIDALAAAGGYAAGGDLLAIVKSDRVFWERVAPRLAIGWWNHLDESDNQTPRDRYARTFRAIQALKAINFGNGKDEIKKIRDLWRSYPALEDKSGLDQMSKACDEYLSMAEMKPMRN
ncbi:MAG: hypothetical protein JO053_11590 [Acidobacteria bacterium]|nr:hypothetical protein [Acidobacteriota bacterium]